MCPVLRCGHLINYTDELVDAEFSDYVYQKSQNDPDDHTGTQPLIVTEIHDPHHHDLCSF